MDLNRYYVPPNPKASANATPEAKAKAIEASTSRFVKSSASALKTGVNRLPTPAAFFERQQKFKELDQKNMIQYAYNKSVKHNLKLRRNELKTQRNKPADDIPEIKGNGVGESELKGVEMEDDGGGFKLAQLENAIEERNERKINRAILFNFFQAKDKRRILEIEDMLRDYQGKEFELFDKIAKEYNVVKENPGKSSKDAIAEVKGDPNPVAMKVDLIEPDTEEELEGYKLSAKRLHPAARALNGSFTNNLKRPDSFMSMSVVSVASSHYFIDPENQDVKEFQEALDKEIKAKLYEGEYITSIKENGGKWWMNKQQPTVHPSQRRRKTMLDALKMGAVPVADE